MSRKDKTTEMVTKSKNKVVSNPDHTLDSPSRDSDSMYDSETASPVPFLCTQDGAEGTADVVWNYYNSNYKSSQPNNSTPISKKPKKSHRLKLPEKKTQGTQLRRTRSTQKKPQLPLELLELNQYVNKLMEKKEKTNEIAEKPQSGSEEDIFADAPDHSPKSIFRTKRCLRKNVLSSRFSKTESEPGLDSDDSINECLMMASQAVEEKISTNAKPTSLNFNLDLGSDLNMNDDSMDAILRNVKSPHVSKLKCESPGLKNDSFDSLLGNLNDSALERLSNMPVSNKKQRDKDKSELQDTSWTLQEDVAHSPSSSRFSFIRHSSMPESPLIPGHVKSTSNALQLGRYNSMPFNDKKDIGDSPIRCTPLEIQKKRQQAREKLLAKRLLPFTQTQQSGIVLSSEANEAVNKCKFDLKHTSFDQQQGREQLLPKRPQASIQTQQSGVLLTSQTNKAVPNCKFELKVPTVKNPKQLIDMENPEPQALRQSNIQPNSKACVDLRSLIEKKRQEALMKLRRKQVHK